MDLLTTARWYVEHGISVIPVKSDGSKSPAFSGWRKFANELPTDAQLVEWFTPGKVVGIGVPCGPASGNLIVLDFECAGSSAYVEWLQRLPTELRSFVESLPTVITPSGGRHIWIRLPESQPGGKIARYAGGKTKIEIRGEGHQVLAPGCPADCHPTGKLYEWLTTPDAFPELDLDALASLVEWSAACNEYMAPEQPRDVGRTNSTPAGEDSPGNDFNRRGSWEDTGLFDAGWKWARKIDDEKGFLTRPGKDGGISASVGMVSSKQAGYPYLFVWSTSTDFTSEVPFSKFAVYAQLKHAGNYSEAARELAREGYGERLIPKERTQGVDLSEFTMKLATPDGEPIAPFEGVTVEKPDKSKEENRKFKWLSELSAQPEDEKWIWKGYLKRGGITLFSALWKCGKSTLLAHLLKSLDGSQSQFLGQDVSPARILYLSEEDESTWAERRDELLIGDHVGIICQHFKVRPTMPEWRSWLLDVAEQVRLHHFDLVVFDTLAKMWAVREENSAGEVDEALLPLWAISKDVGAAIMLIHHNRKSGGDNFVGARGSGALSAFVDVVMEFAPTSQHPKETKRLIKARGRSRDVPVQLTAELRNGQYIGLGDPDDESTPAAKSAPKKFPWEDDAMLTLRAANGEWLTFNDLQESMPEQNGGKGVRKADLLAVLAKWFTGGEVERSGAGKGASPYLYRLVQDQDTPA